ncbi:hypothetical protein HB770_33240 (plasmid) [Rhizobium leguminosarum bv. viciae]|uniref:Uncharacterized protein n=1 Tax=Rhizobium leguminosarum bv. viciae TaxID=387 RepID=A0A7G6RNS2_RHILV|nr:hypothetical protein HB770_33240 [Rhizobium leguminosarum bv. viciae]
MVATSSGQIAAPPLALDELGYVVEPINSKTLVGSLAARQLDQAFGALSILRMIEARLVKRGKTDSRR